MKKKFTALLTILLLAITASCRTTKIEDSEIILNAINKNVNEGRATIKTYLGVENGKEAISYLEENSKKGFDSTSDHIVGIFLDLVMPVLDGFGVLDYLSKKSYLNRISEM